MGMIILNGVITCMNYDINTDEKTITIRLDNNDNWKFILGDGYIKSLRGNVLVKRKCNLYVKDEFYVGKEITVIERKEKENVIYM